MAKDSVALKNFLRQFTRNEHAVAIDKISIGCIVPKQTVYNWSNGLCRIPELHKLKIEEIFNKKIFDRLPKTN